MLEADWRELHDWVRGFYWVPSGEPFEIEAFGPAAVPAGRRFNAQADGGSAIWVRISRWAEPGLALSLGGEVLETVLEGRVLTAVVPPALTERPGPLPLLAVIKVGRARRAGPDLGDVAIATVEPREG